MTTFELRLPCQESDTPDDWFIARDGRQYPSDDLISSGMAEIIAERVTLELGPDAPGLVEAIDKAIERAEEDVRKAALQRRRHAREACFSCEFRTRCLDRALKEGLQHGTWGGYFEEQIRELRREIDRRKKRATQPV